MTFPRSVVWTGAFAVLLALAGVRDADACGGCFHPTVESSPSVVTDHRMVFEITTTQTILWDQVRYTGNPTEFAWVLPVRAGSRVELSHGEWITALDKATYATVSGPQATCTNGQATVSTARSGSGGGCGGSSPSSFDDSTGSGSYEDAGAAPSFQDTPTVDVVSQSTIGPYQAVTIRATGTTGIQDWLVENGFDVPEYMAPVIDSYTSQGLDFIALRLRPNVGVQAMRPVRVITPGADATLPLRMVAAGVGARVGLTLWVIGEGRYQAQNFPNDTIDWAKSLTWNAAANRSNRSDLEAAALATNDGRTWVTEAAVLTSLAPYDYGLGSSSSYVLPSVGSAYTGLCSNSAPRTVPCDDTALPPADGQPDSGAPDAGADDAGNDPSADAGDDGGDAAVTGDGGTTDGGGACTKTQYGCDGYDDLDVAAQGLHVGDIWVTRLRADLPVGALNAELHLTASEKQLPLSPAFATSKFDPPFDPCAASRTSVANASSSRDGGGCTCRAAPSRGDVGTWLMIGATMVALPLVTRRRRRP